MKILYIMSSFNIYGGTPKKTLDLINNTSFETYLYLYFPDHLDCKKYFEKNTTKIYEGYYGRNIYKHIKDLLKIIDQNDIKIIQTQFFMGEVLGKLIKVLRPKIKLIIAFVGAIEQKGIKHWISSYIYINIDMIIYISEYVKEEKEKVYPHLRKLNHQIIYNGTEKRLPINDSEIKLKTFALLDVASLLQIKNAVIIIKAMNIIVNKYQIKDVFFYIAGEGIEKENILTLIKNMNLEKNIFLLGVERDVGQLLDNCDIFVHPCYCEGFGISVAEAMLAKKAVIAAKAGGLTELIENNKSGLLIDPFNELEWANAILELKNNKPLRNYLAEEAEKKAKENYTVDIYTRNYENAYYSLLKLNKDQL